MSFARYPAYKQSAVAWLGSIPQHWSILRLKHACEVFPSNVDKHARDDEPPVRLCNYTDVYYNERITADMSFMEATASTDQVARFTLRAGDTIITKDSETADDIAVSAYVPEDLPGVVCGYHLSMVRPKESICGAYVKRLFDCHYARARFAVAANGLTRVGLGQYALDNVELPFPPFNEQAAIAAFLDRETAKIDALVEEQKRLIELLKEKRQAVISQAVTKGLDPSVPMKDSGVEWLGQVPAHWRVASLGRVTRERCDGPFGSGIKSSHYREEGALVVRLQNIRAGLFNMGEPVYLDLNYFESELACHAVAGGDVLIAGLGDENNLLGRACVAPPDLGPALVKADCFRFRLDSSMCPEFVAHQLSAGAAFDAGQLAAGTTRSRIPLGTMASRKIAYPPKDEQEVINRQIRERLADLDALAREADEGIGLLHERRSALISAAVTGKIDVRGLAPQPESAAA
jgi:type I restriction enzyme S subunit